MDTDTVYLIIALIGCAVGVYGLVERSRSAAKGDGSDITRIETTLDFVAENGRETKTEIRGLRAEMAKATEDARDARANAALALERADAAHERLDAMGAPGAKSQRRAYEQ